jgi:beta-mannosidase
MTRSADTPLAPRPRHIRVDAHERQSISEGWHTAPSPADAEADGTDLDALNWRPARVPGTAACALKDSGDWRPGDSYDFDGEDWWFRTSFASRPPAPGEELVLCFDGIATVAEIDLNGERILESDSMFAPREVDVGALIGASNELTIHCRALAPLLRQSRRPRARWRTRLVSEGNLRFFRTMLLGRAPGFAPGPAAVGPWREVRLERRRQIAVQALSLRASVDDGDGRLAVSACLRSLAGPPPHAVEVELSAAGRAFRAPLALLQGGQPSELQASGELLVPQVALWWPHTHGEPALYEARLIVSGSSQTVTIDAGRIGFRSLAFGQAEGHRVDVDGLDLHVNGVRVFARGCVWTPVDADGLAPEQASLRAALAQARDAGMNLLRIPGTSAYESGTFHDLCDELGLMVWQDFMFANLDYPISEPTFHAAVTREARQLLSDVAGRPSTVLLCGNSEVEQQVAMLGLDPSLGRGELFGELLPTLVGDSATQAAYIPSAPCGGELPFRTNRGVANYYGVGGYRRPLADARSAEVRFAAECLAFSNVPDEAAIEEMCPDAPSALVVHHPRWKAGVPRDVGAGWDFEDVRDHYLELIFGLDPAELRRSDHERYLELSRTVTGEVMADVFGEWRRRGSPCGGGLVLWLRDLAPGAGWGVVDDRGEPKVAYHHLRRALAPVAVWMTDEGLNGVLAHVANDRPTALTASLRVALYRDFEHRVEEAAITVELPPHSVREWDIEALLGRFVDASWAYRFGPRQQDLIVASLEGAGGQRPQLISQAMRFPAGRPSASEPPARLGLQASAHVDPGAGAHLRLRTTRLAYGVRLHLPGFSASDDAFSLEPGCERDVALRPRTPDAAFAGGAVTSVNLLGRVRVEPLQPAALGNAPTRLKDTP